MKMHVENEAPCWGRTTNPSRRVTSLLVIPLPSHIYTRLQKELPRINPLHVFLKQLCIFLQHTSSLYNLHSCSHSTHQCIKIKKNHNQHDFMNMFIKLRLVSAQILGRDQALIIQESEYIQKLLIIKWEIDPFTSRYLKIFDKISR